MTDRQKLDHAIKHLREAYAAALEVSAREPSLAPGLREEARVLEQGLGIVLSAAESERAAWALTDRLPAGPAAVQAGA